MQQSLNNVGSSQQGLRTDNQKRAQAALQGPTVFGSTDSYTDQGSESLLWHVLSVYEEQHCILTGTAHKTTEAFTMRLHKNSCIIFIKFMNEIRNI